MIRITDTPKPRDRFGSIPIRESKPANRLYPGPYLPRRPKPFFLWAWLKKTVVLVLGLGLILLISSPLLIPYLATTLLAEKMAFALNRPVTIARAEFDPLTGTLTLRHLIVGPKLSKPDDPVDPLLSAGKISIAIAPKRLLSKELACNLNADHFFLHLVRDKDGGYNLGQAMDELLSGLPVLPLRFTVNTITAGNSRFVFDDEQTGKNHLAEEINLSISPGQAGPLGLQAKINGLPISLPGTASHAQTLKPESAEQGGPASAPGASDDSALKTAEAMAMVQNLDQAARQYLQQTAPTPVERRTPPLAP